MRAYLFPGQGSQKKGMGADLFEQFPEWTTRADQILGYSLRELCVEDPAGQLGQTQFTQPALFVVNALSYLARQQAGEPLPDFLAGHSLGEYNALMAAGVFDFETGLRLVQKRGALMSQARDGGMAAIIGLPEERIKAILDEHQTTDVDIANFNSPSQLVISGPKESVLATRAWFEEAGARMFVPLKVSAAFHSRYMAEARAQFAEFLKEFQFARPGRPVIANTSARPYGVVPVAQLLADQITHSVRWTESIRYLMGRGVSEFIEVGHGRVLTGLCRAIRREAEPLIVVDEPDVTAGVTENSEVPSPAAGDSAVDDQPTTAAGTPASSAEAPPEAGPGQALGSAAFRREYGTKYAYVVGSMERGISSPAMVVRLAEAGMLGILGTAGLDLSAGKALLGQVTERLGRAGLYGVNLRNRIEEPGENEAFVSLCLEQGVHTLETSGFLQMEPALVRYRLKGVTRMPDGQLRVPNRIMTKVSRPEVARSFLEPAPEAMVRALVEQGQLTEAEGNLAPHIPMCSDLVAESDAGGHTDRGVAYALLPKLMRLRNRAQEQHVFSQPVRLGAAGGIGTPEAASAAFLLGADFVLTGSINQCTVESGTSDLVKDMLQRADVQDTDHAPSGEWFEIGGQTQVLRKGVFFPARANKLRDLYRYHQSLEDLDQATAKQLQERVFGHSFEELFAEIKRNIGSSRRAFIERAESDPKYKMALLFKWYFEMGMRLALAGDESRRVDFLVYCGPAMGAFNQWVKGSDLEDWHHRHVDEIGRRLMDEAATWLRTRTQALN